MSPLISFTGADDGTDALYLRDLTVAHIDRIEWALLLYPEKEGQPRNPTRAKRMQFVDVVGAPWVAAHLCGEQVFREILNMNSERLTELCSYDRLQLNINARKKIFTDEEVVQVYDTLRDQGHQLILQYHDDTAVLIDKYIAGITYDRPDILFDTSRGKGMTPNMWMLPIDETYCGYAGGLNPSNIKAAYDAIDVMPHAPDIGYWLDMESGVRTDNKFDVDKCMQIMDIVR